MSDSNLINLKDQDEAPISVYSWLISLVGMRQAVILSRISESGAQTKVEDGLLYYRLSKEEMLSLFPFWRYTNIRESIACLVEQGYLVVQREYRFSWYGINVEALFGAKAAA